MDAVLTVVGSIVAALLTAGALILIQERRLRREFELDRERLRTDFMAEQVARHLLESERWKKRRFSAIRRRLGGFEDDELRKILVRAGAVRFMSKTGEEAWGLLSRNRDAL